MGKIQDRVVQWVCFLGIGFFLLWGIEAVLVHNVQNIFDRFFGAFLIWLAWIWRKELQVTWKTALLGVATLSLHFLKLYGNTYWGIPFDHIMHTAAGFTIAIFSYNALQREIKNPWKLALVSVFLAFGITSSIEIVEFFGYHILGSGEGILYYGTGDFGEYNNISWDLISNMLGTLIAVVVLHVFRKRKK